MIARVALFIALGVLSAGTAGAQSIPDLNAPRRAAENVVAAENSRLAEQTGQAVPSRTRLGVAASQPRSGPAATGTPDAPLASGPSAARVSPTPSGAIDAAPRRLAGGRVPETVTRESYAYSGVGRRDPFFSLILTDDLRPLLADLRLVGILYEASGRRTVAIMRDIQTNAQYRVTNGSALGRMRVAQIRPRAVIFTVDEFGLSRQDSLVWSDTTRVRN
jgi:hypothetical protein